ncbi:MAG: hypothetical protein ACHQ1G_01435 [Planctomycetota bacterium]
MRKAVFLLALLVVLAPEALGQRAAERYIPIGQSPGLSGKYTYMGRIGTVDAKGRTVGGKAWSATVTEKTRIWLDRSKLGRSNGTGTFADLKAGAAVEVRYEGRERNKSTGRALWIKVEAAK